MIRVMIADDNEIIRDDIREKLESAGFAVSASLPSGAEAAAAYDPASTDAVLMDIEMESALAGIDAARNILAAYPDAAIIYLTSHDDDTMIITAMATGARDFLVKGCGQDELREHLEAAVAGDAKLDARIRRLIMSEYRRLSMSEQSLLGADRLLPRRDEDKGDSGQAPCRARDSQVTGTHAPAEVRALAHERDRL